MTFPAGECVGFPAGLAGETRGGLAEVVFILNRGDTLRHGARDAVHGMT